MLAFRFVSAALVFVAASGASASVPPSVTITYQITGGTLSLPGKPPGSVTLRSLGGQFKVTHPASGTVNNHSVLSGNATLSSFSLQFALDYSSSGSFQTTGLVSIPSAMMVSGLGNEVFQNTASFDLEGSRTVHCLGPASYCSYTGYAQTVPVAGLGATIFMAPSGGLAFDPGAGGTVAGTYRTVTVSAGSYTGPITVNFTGMEIDRVFVPEPGSLPLGVAAISTVLAVVLWRRRAPS